MDPSRLKIEQSIMEKCFPKRHQFVNMDDPDLRYLDVGLKTSSGRTYRLRIDIPADYPSSVPPVYVVYPEPEELTTRSGTPLHTLGPSHDMHILEPDGEYIQLCHYKAEDWHSNVTLYKVALKCLLWLQAYQSHLDSGQPIDHYVNS